MPFYHGLKLTVIRCMAIANSTVYTSSNTTKIFLCLSHYGTTSIAFVFRDIKKKTSRIELQNLFPPKSNSCEVTAASRQMEPISGKVYDDASSSYSSFSNDLA